MTPLSKAKIDRYGLFKASAKMPLIIADGAGAQADGRQYQQIEVYNSLLGQVSGTQCSSDWNGVLLGEHKIAPKYIVHRRGDTRPGQRFYGNRGFQD